VVQFSSAKNITIKIKPMRPTNIGNTEVTYTGTAASDTLLVTPGRYVDKIYVYLKDTNENVYQSYCVPATCNDILNVISPSLPTCLMLEIRDDKGYIYRVLD